MEGRKTRQQEAETRQRLSKIQEARLTKWILVQDSIGFPPTHTKVRDIASFLLFEQGELDPLGKHWMEGFLRRNPEVRTLQGKRIDFLRVEGATVDRIKDFFALKLIPDIRKIPPCDRWNMDEAGIMEGIGDNGLVLGSSRKNWAAKIQPGTRYWTTMIECISAAGGHLKPLVIFKGKTVQQQWFPVELDHLKQWNFTASEKGWTSNEIALAWLKEVFIPLTKPKNNGWRLLVVDGHKSHETVEFMWECFKNKIWLLFLPSHSSHVLQPLDLSIFSALKRAFRRFLSEQQLQTDSSPVGKMTFLRCYHLARLAALTVENILSGWKASGMWPINVAVPLMSPYVLAPRYTFQTRPSTPPATPAVGLKRKEAVMTTPTGSQQLRGLIRDFVDEKEVDPTIRLLFRKICKGLDEQQIQLSISNTENTQLKESNKLLQPKKRRTVHPDPNKRFIKISNIIDARDRYKGQLDAEISAQELETYIFEELCFTWQLE
uniref:HTH CENPB-type domain-containing protein n=1 Tax=Bionectria ochroleuca TaxID=29856 RepID=A0A8H7K3R7_BIOOC